MELYEYNKFWVIWTSCLDKPRTIKEIQRIWKYKGNALYQKGMRKSIPKEMIDDGFIEIKGEVKERGVSGKLVYASLDWVPDFLSEFFIELKMKYGNPLPSQLYECIIDKKKFIRFLDENRVTFFFPEKLKILFGNKENFKNNYEICIIAPMFVLFNTVMLHFLKKQLKLTKELLFIVTQGMVFNPSPKINFLDYSRHVMKDLKINKMPRGMLSQSKLFRVWIKSAQKIYAELI
jgi:hypothetical protein